MAAWLADFLALPAASSVPVVAEWEAPEMDILLRRVVDPRALRFRRAADHLVALPDHQARPVFVESRPSHQLVPALPKARSAAAPCDLPAPAAALQMEQPLSAVAPT